MRLLTFLVCYRLKIILVQLITQFLLISSFLTQFLLIVTRMLLTQFLLINIILTQFLLMEIIHTQFFVIISQFNMRPTNSEMCCQFLVTRARAPQ